jgi:hypothetical protein
MLNPYILLSVAAAALIAGPVQAVNKCTDAAGKVSYQQGDCPSTAKAQQIQTAPDPKVIASNWAFHEQRDEMTGSKTCFALSPFVYTNTTNPGSRYGKVRLELAITKSAITLNVRTLEGSDGLIHHDISDVGMKVDQGSFQPVAQKSGSHGLTFSKDAQSRLLTETHTGKTARLRLRFWPYEKLHDSDPIPLTGFARATSQAMSCLTP